MHIASEMVLGTPAISIVVWKANYPLHCPLHFVVSYVQPVTKHFESRTVWKAPLQSTNTKRMPIYINYLKSEVSIALCCRLCSTHYTAVRIKNCSKSTFAIKIVTMKNTDDFCYEGKHHVIPPNWHLLLSAKMNGTQRRTLVSLWRMHCMYCSMPKGTCRAEAMPNSKKIKPVALAIIELRLSEGISQLLSQSVSYSVSRKFRCINFWKDSVSTCWKHFGLIWKLVWA